jgi:hypothetical protein
MNRSFGYRLMSSQSDVSEHEGCSTLCHQAAVIGECCVIRTRGLLRHNAPALTRELIMVLRTSDNCSIVAASAEEVIVRRVRIGRISTKLNEEIVIYARNKNADAAGKELMQSLRNRNQQLEGAKSSTYRTEPEPSLRLARSTRGPE